MTECKNHAGVKADVKHLQDENEVQWKEIRKVGDKIDKIFNRVNIILGGIVVTAISALLSFAIVWAKSGAPTP